MNLVSASSPAGMSRLAAMMPHVTEKHCEKQGPAFRSDEGLTFSSASVSLRAFGLQEWLKTVPRPYSASNLFRRARKVRMKRGNLGLHQTPHLQNLRSLKPLASILDQVPEGSFSSKWPGTRKSGKKYRDAGTACAG